MIESQVAGMVRRAVDAARDAGALELSGDVPDFEITAPKNRDHGDLSANVALKIGGKPRDVATAIVAHMPSAPFVSDVQIAGPGFINFFLRPDWLHDAVRRALSEGEAWGRNEDGRGASVNVEYVSINPTGPLHVGAGRNAALGDSIARLLEATGHRVTREYYFNDAGRQMELFGESVAARYLELCGRTVAWNDEWYAGAYIADLARTIHDADGDALAGVPPAELGLLMKDRAYPEVVAWIEDVLTRFDATFDVWFTERSLVDTGKVAAVLDRLRAGGHVYDADGAVWLAAGDLGDNRERVLVRQDGYPTYLAADLAYHVDKAERGYRVMIDVWGADHHGQVASLVAGCNALGIQPEQLEIVIYQFVHMVRDGEPVKMSKRAGDILTLAELIDEVGSDAARYTLVRTSGDHDITFDIEQVKKQSAENPVFYVQYAHARIASILRKAGVEPGSGCELLTLEPELELMRAVAGFPDVVRLASQTRQPYRVARYAEELARAFHHFYTECRVISDDEALTGARLALCAAAKQTLANALHLVGVSAPERMERDDEGLPEGSA